MQRKQSKISSNIWEQKEDNKEADWINNMKKEVQGFEDRLHKARIALSNTQESTEHENASRR